MTYVPKKEILEKYANVLVNFALNAGKGVKKGEVVFINIPECAKPFLIPLRNAVMKAGAHPILKYDPDGVSKEYFENATDAHLEFFPEKLLKGRMEQIDHSISILAEYDPHELEGVDPKKIMKSSKTFKPYMEWRNEKENKGKFTWTLALYGTPAMAKEAGMSLEEYWEQIIKACFLDEEDPIKRWKESFEEVERVRKKLTDMEIEWLHVKAKEIDLKIKLGKNRKWLGCSGRNIPSFEVFISPDWRGTEGEIRFNQPLYRYGNLIEDIYLKFEKGKVVKATAKKGEATLKEMIATENADKIGEFSLTDKRLSRINKFMAETLYDENFGGEYGNTHVALGNAYQDSYLGDISKVTKEQWEEMGYNNSVVHTDIISSTPREVTATLPNGEKKLIYKDGEFLI